MAKLEKFHGFFSYAHHDDETNRNLVNVFIRGLENCVNAKHTNAELFIWRDTKHLRVGERFTEKIEKQLSSTDLLIVLLTPRWIGSESCRREYSFFEQIERTRGSGDNIVPILARAIEPRVNRLTDEQREIYNKIKQRQKFSVNVSAFLQRSEAGRIAIIDKLADHIARIIDELWDHRTKLPLAGELQQDSGDVVVTKNSSDVDRPSGIIEPRIDTAILPPVRYFGRKEETATLVNSLTALGGSTLLVLGTPGVGKTTLTRGVATDPAVVEHFSHRRWIVPLETVRSAAQLETAIVRMIANEPTTATFDPANRRFADVLTELGRERSLVVLDNLETPWENDPGGTETVLQRLAAVSNLAILASLRGAVAPLSPQWTEQIELQPLEEKDATLLFCSIARKISPTDPDLAQFLHELGGVPLAIELIAHLAELDTNLRGLWKEWKRVGTQVFAHPGLREERLMSISRSLDLSFGSKRLQASGKRLFRLLGLCPSGMAREDCEELLGDDASEGLRQLRAVGLTFERNDRFDLLPFVRDLARRTHMPTNTDAKRWRGHYLQLVAKRGLELGREGGNEAVARLSPEIHNIEAAFHGALLANDLRQPLEAVRGFAQVLRFTGIGSPAVISDLAEASGSVKDSAGEATCRFWLAVIEQDRSNQRAARAHFEQALPLYQQIGDKRGEANCIRMLGDIALGRADYAAARDYYEKALTLYREVAAVVGEASCIRGIGDIDLARGEYERARASYKLARPLFKQAGDLLGEANCLRGLGDTALARASYGDAALARASLEEARERYERALALFRAVGDELLGEAIFKQNLGKMAFEQADFEAALKNLEDALPRYQQLMDVRGEAECVKGLGDIALKNFKYQVANGQYEKALGLFRQVTDLFGEASCIGSLGDCALAKQDYEGAIEKYEAALKLNQELKNAAGEAKCRKGLGDIARRLCEYEKAQGHYEEARRLYRAAKDVRGEANVKTLIGEIALSHKDKNYEAARIAYRDALELYRQIKDQSAVANCLLRLGDIAMESSDFDAARDLHQEALGYFSQTGEVLGEANCLRGLGALALQCSEYNAALAHYEEALRQFRRIRNTAGEAACIIGLADVASRNKDRGTAEEALSAILSPYLPDRSGDIGRAASSASADERSELSRSACKVWAERGNDEVIAALRRLGKLASSGDGS